MKRPPSDETTVIDKARNWFMAVLNKHPQYPPRPVEEIANEQRLFCKRPQCWPAEKPSNTAGIRSRSDGCGSPAYSQFGDKARRYSALAVDTLVELTKDNYAPSTRFNAATALLDRGYGRPAQSLDLHLSADAITKRLSDMTDAELAALEARMITIPGSLALEHVDEPERRGHLPGLSDQESDQNIGRTSIRR